MINFLAIGAKINEGPKIGEGESYESRSDLCKFQRGGLPVGGDRPLERICASAADEVFANNRETSHRSSR